MTVAGLGSAEAPRSLAAAARAVELDVTRGDDLERFIGGLDDLHVLVNAVAPGWIRTGLTAELHQDPGAARRIVERTPMGRWGEPADVAGRSPQRRSKEAS